ncbi:MAG: type II toxin-antitoxin system RelE/ParE family toxin [Nevskiaceae bacterium]|jgi:phage-related protein|nr:type II toxin-antitoxin system RelE/ParE family toxin [Nevskiaceae bacterium]
MGLKKSPSPQKAQRIELVFYRTGAGNMPVRDWLLSLSVDDRRLIGQDLQRVQFRWPVGMPLVRPLGKGLHEVRTPLPDGTIARVLFCFHQNELYALHGFIKKSQKIPAADLELARKRQKEVENG